MAERLLLKWGTLKSWNLETEKSLNILKRYIAAGVSINSMTQQDTPEQKQLLCELIDALDGEIIHDWSGETMSKGEAKKYILTYN